MRCYLFAAVLFLGSVSAIAQPVVDTITVNGITGSLKGGKKAPYPPNSFVTVEIAPANLIGYAYVVSVDNTEQLKAFIPPVVGASEAAVAATSGAGPFDAARFDVGATRAIEDKELLNQFRKAREMVESLTNEAGAAVAAVEEVERQIDRRLAETKAWPANLKTTRELFLIAAYGSAEFSPSQSALDPGDALLRLRNAEEGGCSPGSLCDTVKKAAAAVQSLQNKIVDEKLKPATPGSSQPDFSAFETAVRALSTQLTAVSTSITATRSRVDRWNAITKRYPDAKLTQRILIDRVSRRYVLSVTRRPVGAPQPASGQPDTAIEKLATTMFEGHALSRLLLATGIAVLFRPDVRTFVVENRIDGDTRKFFVAEKSTNRTEFKPVMTIGAYLSPVDNYHVDQKWTPRRFVAVGTEISTSPTTYILGGGIDYPAGISFNIGITTYEGTRLGEGFVVGQEIPGVGTGTDRVALVTTLPTRTKRQIGYYVSVLFRPSIFSSFRDLAK